MTSLRPPIPKKLAARIRAAQAKVLDARGWIEATAFNSLQDEARWNAFARNPEAFARKYYPGHSVDSYPVQTSRIREKLDKLPARMERNQRDLDAADAELVKVETEVLEEVAGCARRQVACRGRRHWSRTLSFMLERWRRRSISVTPPTRSGRSTLRR